MGGEVEDSRETPGPSRLSRLIISMIYQSRDRTWFTMTLLGSGPILGLVQRTKRLVPYVNTLVPDTHPLRFTGISLVHGLRPLLCK